MRRITFGMGELDKRNPSQSSKNGRNKDAGHKDSDGRGQRDTKAGEGTCNYCKKKGHWKSDCLLLKKKEKTTTTTSSPAAGKSTASSSHPTAAAVAETESHSAKFHISNPLIRIDSINGSDCELFALMDTGSPVSFIDSDNFSKIFTKDFPLEMVDRKFNALSKTPIDVIKKTKTKINFRDFPEHNFDITLHVVSSTFADFDVIIGRDFLEGHNLTLVFCPSRTDAKSFTQLLLESDVCYTNITPETIVEDCEIDFGREEKQRLKNVISECMNECTDTVIDDYSVTVHLKGTSPYAYAPRHPVLRLYKPTAPTELHTDASSQGLGAILLQKQSDAKWAPVAFYSQATNKAEANYHSFELEMLAIVRAVERFHIYLYGITFTIVTDCNALVYAINKANLNPCIARWTLLLQNYDFKVEHRPGKRMAHFDALSRQVCYLETLPLERELELRQLQDTRLKEIANELEFGNDNNKFKLINGLIYRKGDDRDRFVIPESMINNIIRIHHEDMAHCGLEKTYEGIHGSYWFPAIRKRIREYIDNCVICLYANSSTNRFEGTTPSKLLLGYDQSWHSDKNLRNFIDCWIDINIDVDKQREKIRESAVQANKRLRE
ncbi:retrovirus-like pol polyprotein [Lasius niger]|uniref:RNA-directed DNA polymerase n=1 Tax=Lasius niger TaxID=67767 RepID=A0A0J7K5W6_LASNI|nr:retrovirus-like pol polyprotein [Lasius niger]